MYNSAFYTDHTNGEVFILRPGRIHSGSMGNDSGVIEA